MGRADRARAERSRSRSSAHSTRRAACEWEPSVSRLTRIIQASGPERDHSLDVLCRGASLDDLLVECRELDLFRRSSDNLYERVRALFFLYAIHRFHVPLQPAAGARALIPFAGYTNLLKRRFEEAIDLFL